MCSIVIINNQEYKIIDVKEITSGSSYRRETLCTDVAGKEFLLWKVMEETSAIVRGTVRLIGKYFIAELTEAQVELWKTDKFDRERPRLKGLELNQQYSTS